jgi:hypothetical protein
MGLHNLYGKALPLPSHIIIFQNNNWPIPFRGLDSLKTYPAIKCRASNQVGMMFPLHRQWKTSFPRERNQKIYKRPSLLGCYATSTGKYLPTLRKNVITSPEFGTWTATYRWTRRKTNTGLEFQQQSCQNIMSHRTCLGWALYCMGCKLLKPRNVVKMNNLFRHWMRRRKSDSCPCEVWSSKSSEYEEYIILSGSV